MNVKYRKLRKADVPSTRKFFRKHLGFHAPDTDEEAEEWLRKPYCCYLAVFEKGGKEVIVGAVLLLLQLDRPERGVINLIAVEDKYRRRGIGSGLLRHALSRFNRRMSWWAHVRSYGGRIMFEKLLGADNFDQDDITFRGSDGLRVILPRYTGNIV